MEQTDTATAHPMAAHFTREAIDTLQAARSLLDRIATDYRSMVDHDGGRMIAKAETAADAIFDVLNNAGHHLDGLAFEERDYHLSDWRKATGR